VSANDKPKTGTTKDASKKGAPKDGAGGKDFRIPSSSPWIGAWKKAAAVGGIGLAGAAYGYVSDPHRFAFSYLFAFFTFLAIALGSLFFVIVLYFTKAGWGITVRRVAEFFMQAMPVMMLLVVPVILTMGHLFPWLPEHAAIVHKTESAQHAEHDAAGEASGAPRAAPGRGQNQGEHGAPTEIAEAHGDPAKEPWAFAHATPPNLARAEQAHEAEEKRILDGKRPYLNKTFFLVRMALYVILWGWLAQKYFRWSTDQDKTKAVEATAAAQRFSPIATMIFAVTVTFCGIDLLLSLDPMWFSTIFGVYVFAGCALSQIATLILFTLLLRRSGLMQGALTVEHYHDMGKLLFGWIVFWSYISFAQFFLTWYSNIPEELTWFHRRWNENGGTWKGVSLALVGLHFFAPFWFLMSRNVKRRMPLLALGAITLLVMHVVEMYWIVMPNYGPLSLHWLDVACLLGVGGVYLAAVLHAMEGHPLVPVGDPRLSRALTFENA
jgi:hypothetical protein